MYSITIPESNILDLLLSGTSFLWNSFFVHRQKITRVSSDEEGSLQALTLGQAPAERSFLFGSGVSSVNHT